MKRIVFALPVTWLLACSTPPDTAPVPPVFRVQQVPPPDFERDLPLEQPPLNPEGRVCQLGKSCLALDPRPFEACLVSAAKRCVDKATEPLLIEDGAVQADPTPYPRAVSR